MKIKKGDRLLLIAVAIVAVSLILQALGMKSILQAHTPGENYENRDFADNSVFFENGSTSIPKEILARKFLKYKYVSDYGKTLNLFTTQQYEEFKQKRAGGIRDPLTVDEVLYIIEDSIDVYFTYERVVLTGERAQAGSVGSILFYSVGFPDSYESYEELYDQVVTHISQIIWFRLMIHDAGFVQVHDGDNGENGSIVIANENNIYTGDDPAIHSVMLIDDSQYADDSYKNKLATSFYTYLVNFGGKELKTVESPDGLSVLNAALSLTFATKEIVMWDTQNLLAVKVFPAASIETRIDEKLG